MDVKCEECIESVSVLVLESYSGCLEYLLERF